MRQCFLFGIWHRKKSIFFIRIAWKLSRFYRRYAPGGEVALPVIVNACVHVIMYFYYALAAMHIQRKLLAQVKLFVTIIQVRTDFYFLLNFVSIVFVHNLIWLPIVVCLLINLFSPVPQQFFIDLSVNLFTYSIYMVIMICPFISLFTLADLRKQLIPERYLSNRLRRLIYPSTGSRGGEAPAALQRMTQTRMDSNQRNGQAAINGKTSRVIKTESKI